MYLSRLELNTRVKEVKRDIANLYEMHSTLKRAFPDESATTFLWRIENRREGYPSILVQSVTKPSWSNILVQNYFIFCELKKYDVNNFLENRMVLRFRLMANPIVKKNGKRLPLLLPEEQDKWLKKKASINGFSINTVTIGNPMPVNMVKRKTGDIIQLNSVPFEGILQIIDKAKFLKVLENGIGPAKAFGFGLLSIARY